VSEPIDFGEHRLLFDTPAGIYPVGEAALALARVIEIQPGSCVLDLGTGCGLFALIAVRLGARRVVATDVDARVLGCARKNAALNEIAGIEFRLGSLFDPVLDETFDVVIANPPQTPAQIPIRPDKDGGEDGCRWLLPLIEEAHAFLNPGGLLYLLTNSLADPGRVDRILHEQYHADPILEIRRHFDRAEYEGYAPGLFDHLRRLKAEGRAEFDEDGPTAVFAIHGWRCRLRAGPGGIGAAGR